MSRLHELNNMGKALQNLITYLYLVDRYVAYLEKYCMHSRFQKVLSINLQLILFLFNQHPQGSVATFDENYFWIMGLNHCVLYCFLVQVQYYQVEGCLLDGCGGC